MIKRFWKTFNYKFWPTFAGIEGHPEEFIQFCFDRHWNLFSRQTESHRKRYYFSPIQIRLCVLRNKADSAESGRGVGRTKVASRSTVDLNWLPRPVWLNFWSRCVNKFDQCYLPCSLPLGALVYCVSLFIDRLFLPWCLYFIYIVRLVQPDVTTHFHWLPFSIVTLLWTDIFCSHVLYLLNLAYHASLHNLPSSIFDVVPNRVVYTKLDFILNVGWTSTLKLLRHWNASMPSVDPSRALSLLSQRRTGSEPPPSSSRRWNVSLDFFRSECFDDGDTSF